MEIAFDKGDSSFGYKLKLRRSYLRRYSQIIISTVVDRGFGIDWLSLGNNPCP